MSKLPRKAQRLLETLERLQAPGSGASPAEVDMARRHVERILSRHGLAAGPCVPAGEPEPAREAPEPAREAPTPRALLVADIGDAPLRVLPPVAVVPEGADWALALGATVAEACGAKLVASDGPDGVVCLAFAGAGPDPEIASASWAILSELTEGRGKRWCRGFAASIDERLDATIEQPAVAARVARVAAWLDRDPFTDADHAAPLLDTDDEDARDGAAAALAVAL